MELFLQISIKNWKYSNTQKSDEQKDKYRVIVRTWNVKQTETLDQG